MSRFRAYDRNYGAAELAIFQQAYEDACRKLGIDPSPPDDTVYRSLRDGLAKAVKDAVQFGERDPANLSAFAISFGLRNWHLQIIPPAHTEIAGSTAERRPEVHTNATTDLDLVAVWLKSHADGSHHTLRAYARPILSAGSANPHNPGERDRSSAEFA